MGEWGMLYKHFECSAKEEKHYIRTSLFTI